MGCLRLDIEEHYRPTLKVVHGDGDVAQRWLSTDPLAANFASWSPYNYVMGNPISLIDPDGKAATRVVTSEDGNELFRLDDGREEITSITARALYDEGTQWFSPAADNFMPLLSVNDNLLTTNAVFHTSWNQLAEFAEVGRAAWSYGNGGSGDWKVSEQGAAGFFLTEIDGQPYWSDGLGQVPFAVNTTKQNMLNGLSEEESIRSTVETGQAYGDGSFFFGEGDETRSFDNAMILRASLWTTRRYDAHEISRGYNAKFDDIKVRRGLTRNNTVSPQLLATPVSNETMNDYGY